MKINVIVIINENNFLILIIDEEGLDEFMSGLKLAASPKEKSVLDYVIKNMINIPKYKILGYAFC